MNRKDFRKADIYMKGAHTHNSFAYLMNENITDIIKESIKANIKIHIKGILALKKYIDKLDEDCISIDQEYDGNINKKIGNKVKEIRLRSGEFCSIEQDSGSLKRSIEMLRKEKAWEIQNITSKILYMERMLKIMIETEETDYTEDISEDLISIKKLIGELEYRNTSRMDDEIDKNKLTDEWLEQYSKKFFIDKNSNMTNSASFVEDMDFFDYAEKLYEDYCLKDKFQKENMHEY